MTLLLFILAQTDDPYAEVLRRSGIEPDAAGVVRYLSRLAPTDANRARAADLVRKLGDDDFDVREAAASELSKLSPMLRVLGSDAIDRAMQSNDLEIQSRLRRLMKEAGALYVLRTALLRAARLKAAGTVEAVLPLVEHVKDPALRGAMAIAARDAAGRDDEALLRAALNDGDAGRRALAAVALGRLLADLTPVKTLLDDAHEEVRLAAARALLDRGDAGGLEPLVALLSSADANLQRHAARTLHQATGRRFESPEAWTEWIRKEGASAKLAFPLPDRPPEFGRTLICLYGAGKVIELDRDGKVIFEKEGLSGAFACQGLPNGHRLVSAYNGASVVEFDDKGEEVWKKDGLPQGPLSVQRLESGNTLVTCSEQNRIIEVAPDGSIARDVTIDGRPTDARQLENGNWLVTLYNSKRIVEIDLTGSEVWKIETESSPFNAQRLENGNTLVCEPESGRIVEYDASGANVWVKDGLGRPYDVQRLDSGNTLVADYNSGVKEFDPDWKVVWSHDQNSVGRASRY